jgi:F-type H+-transporting ATPase subunit delta
MTGQGIARRYAKALLGVAEGQEGAWDDRLTVVASALTSDLGRRLFLNPTIAAGAKAALAKSLIGEDQPELEHFLGVVIEHRRERLIQEIAEAFHQLVLARAGYTEAVIETARALEENEKQATKTALDRFLGKKSWPIFRVAPGLVGGARIRFGDRMIDGSVVGDLERLRNLLTRANQSEVSP